MDDLVIQAMQKWPNVPDCFGWLGLDARGDWYMRDDQAQKLGAFVSSKGSRLQHEKLIDFIGRNYESDEQGRWYFQNGPQRVFVELENTPWILRIEVDGRVISHTGQAMEVLRAITDEKGYLYLECAQGLGLVHTQDVQRALTYWESFIESAQTVEQGQLGERFGFVRSPLGQY
jgi:Protein of unknown function (DUF2946)